MIPKILIQTWRSADVPDKARRMCDSWRLLNPDFDFRFYDDDAARALVQEAFPQFLDLYDGFPYPVMRADFFRYAALHRHGGVYADIDMECIRPFRPLLGLAPVVVGLEAHLTERRRLELGYEEPAQIANCILLAQARHPILLEAMQRAAAIWTARPTASRDDIEDVTGPRMFTRLFYDNRHQDIAVTRQMVLTPPRHYPDIWPINALIHARHHFFGSWKSAKNTSVARKWIERDLWPNPFGDELLERRLTGSAVAGKLDL